MCAVNYVEGFTEYGKNGEVIPEEWDFDEIDKRYPYILEIVKVSWKYEGKIEEFSIGEDCTSASVLPDRTGVLVLQSSEKYGSDNAIIVNPDGTIRFRLKNPFGQNPYCKQTSDYSFGGSTIEGGRLALIVGVCTKHEDELKICGDWVYELDTDTGDFQNYRPMNR